MKLSSIVALTITLSVVVEGTWWAAAVQPAIISLGAVLGMGTLDHDVLDVQPTEWKSLQPFISKQARLKDLLRGKRRPKPDKTQPSTDLPE